jgi:hypothetical protein
MIHDDGMAAGLQPIEVLGKTLIIHPPMLRRTNTL